jgi:hypothetical protein
MINHILIGQGHKYLMKSHIFHHLHHHSRHHHQPHRSTAEAVDEHKHVVKKLKPLNFNF